MRYFLVTLLLAAFSQANGQDQRPLFNTQDFYMMTFGPMFHFYHNDGKWSVSYGAEAAIWFDNEDFAPEKVPYSVDV